MKRSPISWPLLLLGMFAQTQINVGGNIGISELFIFLAAPILFMRNINLLRRDGFMPIVTLAFFTIIGCFISGVANQTPYEFFSRGLAATYSVFASIVVFHHFLRQNLDGVRWVLLGFAISVIINIFVFTYGAEHDTFAQGLTGMEAAQNIMSGTLFWVGRLNHWLLLPIKGWYLQTPLWYSCLVPLGLSIFSVATTGSGRSAALGTLGGVLFVLLGRKSCAHMKFISRNFVSFLVYAFVVLFVIKGAYIYLGKNGMLNEHQQQKFFQQTHGGTRTGTLQLLMAGRVEVFCGLYAMCKKPIVGYGPWAVDKDRLYFDFMEKYGTPEDEEVFYRERRDALLKGSYGWLPCHSMIIQFWMWFGIAGLVFWLYVLRQMYVYLKRDIAVVPQWFGYLAVSMPAMLWNIFFSPFGSRLIFGLYFVVLMFNRAIAERKVKLPPRMAYEALRYAR